MISNKEALDALLLNSQIVKYERFIVEFVPGSESRESERLILHFPNGQKLFIDTFCSGSSKNTSLMFGLNQTSINDQGDITATEYTKPIV